MTENLMANQVTKNYYPKVAMQIIMQHALKYNQLIIENNKITLKPHEEDKGV